MGVIIPVDPRCDDAGAGATAATCGAGTTYISGINRGRNHLHQHASSVLFMLVLSRRLKVRGATTNEARPPAAPVPPAPPPSPPPAGRPTRGRRGESVPLFQERTGRPDVFVWANWDDASQRFRHQNMPVDFGQRPRPLHDRYTRTNTCVRWGTAVSLLKTPCGGFRSETATW